MDNIRDTIKIDFVRNLEVSIVQLRAYLIPMTPI